MCIEVSSIVSIIGVVMHWSDAAEPDGHGLRVNKRGGNGGHVSWLGPQKQTLGQECKCKASIEMLQENIRGEEMNA